MAFPISAWAIRKPLPSIVLFLVLTILGLFGFANLPITRFPNIDAPFVSVTVTQSGAAPSELETQVTKKVEDAVAGIAGIKHITSTVSEGNSTTTVEFRLETQVDRALTRERCARPHPPGSARARSTSPSSSASTSRACPSSPMPRARRRCPVEELSWFVDDTVARDLQGVRGVSKIERVGGVDREIRVTLDPDRLAAFGVTAAEVNRQLRATHVDLAGGRGEVGSREQSIRTLAGTATLESLADTSIALSGGRKVRLEELGEVTDGHAEMRTFARIDGEPVVAFAISRSKGASDATLAELIDARIARLQARFPRRDSYCRRQVRHLHAGQLPCGDGIAVRGAALAVAVVLLFLRNWRATLITALTLPLAVIPTFWAMDLMGFSLNLVSLLAITLVTGILVDDAIVEIENIARHMQMGKTPWRAALEAADEIWPCRRRDHAHHRRGVRARQLHGRDRGAILQAVRPRRRRCGTVLAAGRAAHHADARGLFPAPRPARAGDRRARHARLCAPRELVGAPPLPHRADRRGAFRGLDRVDRLLPSGFLPGEDVARTLLVVELPPGARLADTDAVTRGVVARLRERPEVKSVFIDGGRTPNGGREVRRATLTIQFVHKTQRKKTQKILEAEILHELADVPDIRFWRLNENGQRGLTLLVTGDDPAVTADISTRLASEMRTLPFLQGVISTAALDRAEIRIRPRADLAADLGVSTDTIAETLRVATIGDIGANLAKFDVGTRQIPIRVQLDERARMQAQTLETLKVPTARGGPVPLATVAEISFGQGPTSIERFDRVRRIAVEADMLGTDALGEVIEQSMQLPAARNLPPGVEIRTSGDAEVMAEVFQSFATAMGAGLLMVFGVLVLLFGSFLQPVTILFSLPLSFGGVVLALLVTQRPISMPVVIGLLMLMGIVTKNGDHACRFPRSRRWKRASTASRRSSMPGASVRVPSS